MKRVLFATLIFLISITAFCGTKLITGDFHQIYKNRNVPVILDWSNAIYGKSGTIEDFLDNALRNDNWHSESLFFFILETNKKISEYGTRLVQKKGENDCHYIVVIEVMTISKEGDIEGVIKLIDKETEEGLALVKFSSDERDDDDRIAFRDQLENIGENFGSILRKQFKKIKLIE